MRAIPGICTVALLTVAQSVASAQEAPPPRPGDELSREEIITACYQGRVRSLPNPFRDLSPNDWAYESVLKLYYCPGISPDTPPETIDRLLQEAREEA
ncbi:MAG: S-layer protein [Coleofasciculaceae cyanobacterium SM2_3_26]|nr:S-layer protein [Coleofasciculaceae cyanobacterium SM2_3_26]